MALFFVLGPASEYPCMICSAEGVTKRGHSGRSFSHRFSHGMTPNSKVLRTIMIPLAKKKKKKRNNLYRPNNNKFLPIYQLKLV